MSTDFRTDTRTARDAILGRIGRALGMEAKTEREVSVDTWWDQTERSPRPARARTGVAERATQFAAEAARNHARVIEVESPDDLPALMAGYLRDNNLGGAVRIAPDPELKAVDWSTEPFLTVTAGKAEPGDILSVSRAVSGAAETGSVLFVSGPESPATLHVLPLHHVSVIAASDIEAGYEDAFAKARAANGGAMPRALNMITGPSRTADIEQTLLMGAHGPQHEIVVIVRGR